MSEQVAELESENTRLKNLVDMSPGGGGIMRRAVGFSSYHDGAERRCYKDAEQAEHLQQWVDVRRKQERIQVIPKTELNEEQQIERIVQLMYLVGMPCAVLAAGLIIFLLIVHFGWWTVPALASAAGLRWIWKCAE